MNRLALFSILLVAGLAMGGVAAALGANDLLQGFAGKEVALVVMNDQLKVYEGKVYKDGKLVKEITLSPGGKYIIETPGGRKVVIIRHKEVGRQIEKAQAEHKKEMDKWLEIVNKDSRIYKLTNGEGIHEEMVSSSIVEGDVVTLMVKVGGKYYKITIDLNSEIVKSVEEQSSGRAESCYGPGCSG